VPCRGKGKFPCSLISACDTPGGAERPRTLVCAWHPPSEQLGSWCVFLFSLLARLSTALGTSGSESSPVGTRIRSGYGLCRLWPVFGLCGLPYYPTVLGEASGLALTGQIGLSLRSLL
jgi:hypothetical protein